MNTLTDFDKGWIVGLLEGESSIGAWTSRNNKYARVEISSTDPEIIEQLHRVTGIGNINRHNGNSKKKESHKTSTTWRVARAEDVLDLLHVYSSSPIISAHRKIQVAEAVMAARAVVERNHPCKNNSRAR